MIARRGLVLAAAGALGGCGFRPLYLPQGGHSVASEELSAVYVPPMAERAGQLLRQSLQQRLEGASAGVAKKYELITAPSISGEGIGIQRDNSTTRVRLTATAQWSLRLLDVGRTVIGGGSARVTDGYNILNQQYFAAELEGEQSYRRIADTLADQIVLQLGIFLKRRAEAAPA